MVVKATLVQGCEDEDYIDIELSSPSPHSREFEFQMCSDSNGKEASACCTADELFHNGKLIPLHLLHRRAKEPCNESAIGFSTTALFKKADSCDISPSESCRASCELDIDDRFFEWSEELSGFIHRSRTCKSSLSKQLKLTNHSVLAQKLRASRAYLKALFKKSACSEDSCAESDENRQKAEEGSSGNYKNRYFMMSKKNPFEVIGRTYPTIASIIKNGNKDGIEDNVHRRSFSGAIKRHSSNSSSASSSSSSSFSLNSNGTSEVNLLRRSSSATEVEGSIEAAIAHCKKSHQAPT